jgi:hypothetical protein
MLFHRGLQGSLGTSGGASSGEAEAEAGPTSQATHGRLTFRFTTPRSLKLPIDPI